MSPDLVRKGHFVFESGLHGDTWLELDLLIADPTRMRASAKDLAEQLAPFETDVVCGPLEGGAFLAQWVAEALGTSFAYTTRDGLPPAFAVHGRRAIVVDDAINAGFATAATVEALRGAGCAVTALGSAIVCAPEGPKVGDRLGIPQVFLEEITTNVWPAADCPLCSSTPPARLGTAPA